jgi:murein DD-endopeptidase MepM/ murein hydrolase activator NlpD
LAALAGLRRPAARVRVLLPLGLAAVLACCCGALGITAIFGAIGDSSAHGELVACRDALGVGDPAALAALDDEQRGNGALIVEVGIGLAVPPRGWVIAVATAAQESSLRNLPHLGADNDHDSLGLFQQRPSHGWGTPEQIMDPTYASTAFYERLLQVQGWEQLPLTVAAQTVQRSAHPDAYAKHEPLAVAVVNEAAGGAVGAAAAASELRCAEFGEVTAAGWTLPAPGPVWSGFRTANRPSHYGIDIGAARGTPVRAAADGVVTLVTCNASLAGRPYSCDVDGSPAVSGCGWYLTVRHGEVLTRYCHLLSRPQVEVGEQVTAGQPLGVVGTSGNSSGPHLHFEVEIHTIIAEDGGGITLRRAQTDPVAFLAARGIVVVCVSAPADCQPVLGDRVRTERR